MSDEYRLTQTGAQVQADLNKVEGMAEIKSVGSGLSLSSSGELSASGGSGGGGTQLYLHQITGDSIIKWAFVSTTSEPITGLIDLNNLLKNSKIIQVFYIGNPRTLGDVRCSALISYNSDASAKTLTYYDNCTNKWVNVSVSSDGFTEDAVTAL